MGVIKKRETSIYLPNGRNVLTFLGVRIIENNEKNECSISKWPFAQYEDVVQVFFYCQIKIFWQRA